MEENSKPTIERTLKGTFVKGHAGGPGRKRGETQVKLQYFETMIRKIPLDKWEVICEKAVAQALEGDHKAREWIANYLIGRPLQAVQVSGPNGGPLISTVVMPLIVKMIDRHPELRDELENDFREMGLPAPASITVVPPPGGEGVAGGEGDVG